MTNSNPTPNYNSHIPPKILTPDKVETPIGILDFFDGLPDEATVQKLYDNLIFMLGSRWPYTSKVMDGLAQHSGNHNNRDSVIEH